MEKYFKIPDSVYNVLKWVVVLVLPGLSTLYFGLAKVWGLPFGSEIPTTITLIDTFLGAVLCITTMAYNKVNEGTEE